MIDLHSHLLPGLDDGADDMETALAMARLAVASGTTHLMCTPHIHPGRYDNTAGCIADAVVAFRAALEQADIPLQVASAAEVRFDMEIMINLPRGEVPFVGRWQGRDVLLLEFPHGDIPFGAERLVQWLLQREVVPLIAHPERNKAVMRNPARLKPFLELGCLLQVTAGSYVGRFGERARVLAEELTREGAIAVVASDAHNVQARPPLLGEGFEAVSRLVGESAARALVLDRPWSIAESRFGGS